MPGDPAVRLTDGQAPRPVEHACGCREGAVTMVATTAAAALWVTQDPLALAGVAFAAAAVGKALGLLTARLRAARA
jgi:hypothetical protein